jgi:anti-sigma regulatory factor (Ser/Thr protein kinase)
MDPESRSERTASATDAAGQDAPDVVLVRVPADPDYLAVIRSASAHVGTKFGCTLSEVADLRLAVDEACGLLLRCTVPEQRGGASGDVECRFVLDGPALRVIISRQAQNAAPPQSDEFGWTILGALVDDIVWRVEGPIVHVEITKRRAAGGEGE